MSAQRDFFTQTEIEDIHIELAQTKEQLNNLRKAIFGRYDNMVNKMTDIEKNMMCIQAAISEDLNNKITRMPF